MRLIHRLFLLLLITVSHIFLNAQSEQLIVPNNSPYCLNKKTNEFVVFENANTYYTKTPSAKSWQQHAYTFIGDNTTFDAFKELYRPITLSNGRLFFVYTGIGEVYELVNDTLKRVDHSFKHENQFGHSLFEHNNRIYAFGGYGLFTFKNLLLYYDDLSKEWFQVDTPLKPTERANQFFQLIKHDLYIFGGGYVDNNKFIPRKDCWKFNFKSKKWIKLGQIEKNSFLLHFFNGSDKEELPLEISVSYPSAKVIDIPNNKIQYFENSLYQKIVYAIFDKTKKHLLLEKRVKNTLIFFTLEKKQVLQRKILETSLFEAETSEQASTLLVGILVFILVTSVVIVVWLKRKKRPITEKAVPLTLKLKNNNIFIGERMINTELTLLEFRILKKFIELKDTPIDIVALNELFEDENTSHAAQKKRRETTLKTLREKLAFFLNVPQESVILETRDSNDKRIKLFVLNPDILG
jgi:hypothetical protein